MNINELKAAYVRKGMTQEKLAAQLNISVKTFRNKMQRGVFGSDEIEKMIKILDIKDPYSIFFSSLVS